MKRSFLTNLFQGIEGIDKSVIDSILDENGRDVETEKTKTQEALNEVTELKKVDSEGLQKQIDKLTNDLATKTQEYTTILEEKTSLETQLTDVEKGLKHQHQVDMYLINQAKPKNLKAMKALINKEKLSSIEFDEDGKSEALDEIIKNVVKENGYLFGEDSAYDPAGGSNGNGNVTMTDAIQQGIQGQMKK